MEDSKKLRMENRKAPRFNPEPDDAESALFFKNEITIKFPCDTVEREVTDLSETGLKVFLEDKDPLIDMIGKKVKALLTLSEQTINIAVTLVHKTDDDYGLSYVGCRFDGISKKNQDIIMKYLKEK